MSDDYYKRYDLRRHPLLQLLHDTVCCIEGFPASEHQTKTVTVAGSMRDVIVRLLDDRDNMAAQLAVCAQYLKEDETPAECIERNRADANGVLTLLAQARADRDRLAAELAAAVRWKEDAVLLCAKRGCAQRDKRVSELEAELAQARADAERYRWLRDAASAGQWSYLEGCAGDALDEQVDKWRAASSAGGRRADD